jgi:hypothetical protein
MRAQRQGSCRSGEHKLDHNEQCYQPVKYLCCRRITATLRVAHGNGPNRLAKPKLRRILRRQISYE